MAINLRTLIQNQGLKTVLWCFWMGINIYLFTTTYILYATSDKYHYLYMVLKDSICISRACAMVINFNCALILLPMCRTMSSWIRCKVLKHIHSNPRRLINHTKGIHIMCAYTVCVLGVIHSLSHLVNCLRFHLNFTDAIENINVGNTKRETTLWLFLSTIPGWSGVLMLAILAIVVLSSFQAIRRKNFELFWYTHHMSIGFLILLCLHGFGNITKYQVNLDKHPRACHSLDHKMWTVNKTMCKEYPKFASNQAQTWMWIIGPLCLYVIDRLIRMFRSMKDVQIANVILHEGKMIELHMLKKDFKSRPGQYILLQCPNISEFEWHAFTLTKCPSGDDPQETFSVHMKVGGDWTSQLSALLLNSFNAKGVHVQRVGENCVLNIDKEKEGESTKGVLPIIRVDGPYGSPNEDCFRYPVNLSVAAGIGVTPFAAVLEKLKHFDPNTAHPTFKMKRFYLVWTCRDVKEFTWFLQLMFDTVVHLNSINMGDMLVCDLHVSRGASLTVEDPSMSDYRIQWLQKRLKYGRPKFDEVLKKVALNYSKTRIGVFFCGPGPLGKVLFHACQAVSCRGNSFVCHKESFA